MPTPSQQEGESEAQMAGRFWPTDDRRPGETIAEWCRRLDSYHLTPGRRLEGDR